MTWLLTCLSESDHQIAFATLDFDFILTFRVRVLNAAVTLRGLLLLRPHEKAAHRHSAFDRLTDVSVMTRAGGTFEVFIFAKRIAINTAADALQLIRPQGHPQCRTILCPLR